MQWGHWWACKKAAMAKIKPPGVLFLSWAVGLEKLRMHLRTLSLAISFLIFFFIVIHDHPYWKESTDSWAESGG